MLDDENYTAADAAYDSFEAPKHRDCRAGDCRACDQEADDATGDDDFEVTYPEVQS